MTTIPKELQEMLELCTGLNMKELLSDDERYISFYEVSQGIQINWSQFRKTKDKKYLVKAARWEGVMKAMQGKLSEGKTLHMKPSELSELIAIFQPTLV